MSAILLYMIFVLLTFRTHYAIDISTGLIVAHYSFIIVSHFVVHLDNFFKKIYNKGIGYFEKSKWYNQKAK